MVSSEKKKQRIAKREEEEGYVQECYAGATIMRLKEYRYAMEIPSSVSGEFVE